MRKRATPVRSWFLDVGLVVAYRAPAADAGGPGPRACHPTAPGNRIYTLHEALA